MITNIDIQRSKTKERLILHGLIANIKEIVMTSFVLIMLVYVIVSELYESISKNSTLSVILYLLGMLLILILFYLDVHYTSKLKKLVRIKGHDEAHNKTIVLDIIKNMDWKIISSKNNLIIARTTPLISVNWQLTVIFDNNDILINSMHLGMSDFVSPMFYIGNSKEIRQFKIDFEKQIINTA